jgi:hypothetical protein
LRSRDFHLSIGNCKLHSQYQAKAYSYHLFNIFSTSTGFGGKHLSYHRVLAVGSEFWHSRRSSSLCSSPKAPGTITCIFPPKVFPSTCAHGPGLVALSWPMTSHSLSQPVDPFGLWLSRPRERRIFTPYWYLYKVRQSVCLDYIIRYAFLNV